MKSNSSLELALVMSWLVCIGYSHAEAQAPPLEGPMQLAARVKELDEAGRHAEAIPLALAALAANEATHGPDHPDTADSLNTLAELYRSSGAYPKAEPLFRRALAVREKAGGTEHPDIAASLSGLGDLYRITAEYAKAEPLLQRALAMRQKILGPGHPDTAKSLNELAVLYKITGRISQAEPLYRRALQIRETVLGSKHPATATVLNNLASLHYATGAYAKAEPLYRRALAIREQALSPGHPDVAASINNLAGFYYATGAFSKAASLFERALVLRTQALGSEHSEVAASLNNLAALHYATGAYGKAEPLYQRALAIREKALGSSHPQTAQSLNNLAALRTAMGSYDSAEPLLQRSLAIREATLGTQHPETAAALNNLAKHHRDMGDYARAEPLYERAVAIAEATLSEHPETASYIRNLAELYSDTGAYDKARPLCQRALDMDERLHGPGHPDTAASLNDLAVLHQNTGAYAEAEKLHQRALAIREKVLGPTHPDTATSLNNLAALYNAAGSYAKAEAAYRRAVAISEKASGPEHPDTAISLANLAVHYRTVGAYNKAGPLYERVLAIQRKQLGPGHPGLATSLGNLATLHYVAGHYSKAEAAATQSSTIRERNLIRFLLSGSEARKRAYLDQLKEGVGFNVSLSLAHPSDRSATLGLKSVLQHKGRGLDAQANAVAILRHSTAPADRALLDQLIAVAQEFSALVFRGPQNTPAAGYRKRLATLGRRQDVLQTQLAARSAALGQTLRPLSLANIQRALPAQTVLIEWVRYRSINPVEQSAAHRYVAYVLEHRGAPRAVDIGDAVELEALIAGFRDSLVNRNSSDRAQRTAALSHKLLRPLQPYFVGKTHLLLSPDAALNLIPFAALLDAQGDYLIRRFDISYLTSGRDLANIAREGPARSAEVLLANPDYGQEGGRQRVAGPAPQRSAELDRGRVQWRPLPGTASEVTQLQALLGLTDQQVWTGRNATEARLRTLRGPRILHLATHGFFLEDEELPRVLHPALSHEARPASVLRENPLLRSGLALAGANTRRSGEHDDGILTAAEVAELDLNGTQLVVLSACETALGTINAGEGVYGLRRALVLAGAQSQVVSLWKVSDAATPSLMVDYYRRLLNGDGRAQALRAAQLAMLNDPKYQHPYYWSAFIPIGNWMPMDKRGP